MLRTSAVLALKRDAQDDPATLEWLQVATGRSEVALPLTQLLEKDMWRVSSTVIVQPHSVPGCVVALKVPLPPLAPNRSSVDTVPAAGHKIACSCSSARALEAVWCQRMGVLPVDRFCSVLSQASHTFKVPAVRCRAR